MKKSVICCFMLVSLLLSGCSAGQQSGYSSNQSNDISSNDATSQNTIKEEITDLDNYTSLTTNGGSVIELSSLEHLDTSSDSKVYYISDISSDAMIKIYNTLGWTPTGNVGVKLSTGEPPASNYLSPDLIKGVVGLVDGTIVECNTAYGGSRASTACLCL